MWPLNGRQTAVFFLSWEVYWLGKLFRSRIPIAFIRDSFPSILFPIILYYSAISVMKIAGFLPENRFSLRIGGVHVLGSILLPEVICPLLSARYTGDPGDCLGSCIGWLLLWFIESRRRNDEFQENWWSPGWKK